MTWAPPYTDTATFRIFVRDDVPDTDTDTLIYTPAIETASRLVDRSCGRQFGSIVGEMDALLTFRYAPFYVGRDRQWVVSVDDIFSTSTLVIDGTAYDSTVHEMLPRNAVAQGKPYTAIALLTGSWTTSPISIDSNDWGWVDGIPPTIVNATLIQASRIVKRRDAPFGVAGSPDLGNELRLLAKLDPDVELMVSAYRRYW